MYGCTCLLASAFIPAVLRDPDGNPYSLLDNTETDQTADTDASDSHASSAGSRRRRSRRRRTDEDATLMDGMSESDNASLSENGLGKLPSARLTSPNLTSHRQRGHLSIAPLLLGPGQFKVKMSHWTFICSQALEENTYQYHNTRTHTHFIKHLCRRCKAIPYLPYKQ